MEVKEAVRKRRSIRAYKTDPVPRSILTDIVETALRSPSAMNVQPWEIVVVSGKALDEIRQGNIDMMMSGKGFESNPGVSKPYEGIYRQRQRILGFALYDLLGIERNDMQKRIEWTMKGCRSFDAPASIIIYMDDSLDERYAASDIGGLVQTICLLALDHGLGTCINDQGILSKEVVRKVTGIPASKRIFISIAIGYPDWDHPANHLVSEREDIENIAKWIGFD